MANEVILDIETIGDIKNISQVRLTVASVYNYATDRVVSFVESELGNLWPILEKAERVIGYNSEHFDLPVLNNYYTGDLLKFPHLDLLNIIKQSTGSRFKLNDIAKATLQIEKSSDGLTAQRWWEEGRVEDVKKYCEQDVKLTKEIYEYGRKNKMLYYPTLTNEIVPFAVNFDPPIAPVNARGEKSGNINLTLPI